MLTDCYSTEILHYCGTYYIKFKSETKPTLSKWLILLAMNQWKNHECETLLLLKILSWIYILHENYTLKEHLIIYDLLSLTLRIKYNLLNVKIV